MSFLGYCLTLEGLNIGIIVRDIYSSKTRPRIHIGMQNKIIKKHYLVPAKCRETRCCKVSLLLNSEIRVYVSQSLPIQASRSINLKSPINLVESWGAFENFLGSIEFLSSESHVVVDWYICLRSSSQQAPSRINRNTDSEYTRLSKAC